MNIILKTEGQGDWKKMQIIIIKAWLMDDYSTSPKLRQIVLQWCYELVESDLLWFIFLFI